MKYQKLKRNLYTACVVANLFLIPSPVLWAEQSYAQSTRLSLELSNATISDVFASVEKNIVSFILTQFVRNYTGMSM